MNAKTLLLLPAAIALAAPAHAYSNFRFGLNLALPLPLFYPAPVYARTVVYQAPPQSVAEQVTASPGPGYVWMGGHWSSVNNTWVWVGGHWELPPSPSATWVAGHWVQGNSGWVWVDGAWVNNAPPTPPLAGPGQPPTPPQAPTAAMPTPSSPAPDPVMADGTEVSTEPPAPIVEYVPAYPYPDAVWIGGYWGWRGSWYWNTGHFVRPPYRGAVWVSGGWGRGGRGWAWRGGHWR